MKQTSCNKCKDIRFDIYDSKKELRRSEMLKILHKKGIIHHLKENPRYDIKVGGLHICTYIGDFEYIDSDGIKIVEDIKGARTGVAYKLFSIKRLLMKAVNGIDIVEVI